MRQKIWEKRKERNKKTTAGKIELFNGFCYISFRDHDTSDDIPSTATTTTGEMIAVQKSSLPQKGGKKSKRQKQQNDIEDDM